MDICVDYFLSTLTLFFSSVTFIQTKFSSRSRGWVELPSDADCRARIKLRLDHGLKNNEDARRLSQASQCTTSELDSRRSSQEKTITSNDCEIDLHNKQALMDMFEDTLEIRVADVPLVLSMSSVTGLADLAEDEIIPKPIPMEVRLFPSFFSLEYSLIFYHIFRNSQVIHKNKSCTKTM